MVLIYVLFVDHSKGFGGKYGVQKDRVDKVTYGILRYVFVLSQYRLSLQFSFFTFVLFTIQVYLSWLI